MPRLGGKLCAEAYNHVEAWSGANYVAVISNPDFKSIRISDSKTFKTFHAVRENVWCFTQGSEFPGVRGQAISSQWRTGSVRHDWDFAINLLLPFSGGVPLQVPSALFFLYVQFRLSHPFRVLSLSRSPCFRFGPVTLSGFQVNQREFKAR